MDSRWKRLALAGAGLASCLFCGCGHVAMTIAVGDSPSPVMFGPVRTLGAGGATPELSRDPGRTPFHHEETAARIVTYPGVDNPYASTTPVREGDGRISSGTLCTSDRPWLAWKVREATGHDPARRIDLTSVRCRGFFSVYLVMAILYSSCEADGFVSTPQ